MKWKILPLKICFGIVSIFFVAADISAQTRTVRVATYNIEADVNGNTAPLPGLIAPPGNTNDYQAGGVLEGIGEELLNGNAQPVDVLALEETTSNTQTVTPIVNALNIFYGVPGMYASSSYQATESGGDPSTGNGPNAIVYNTRTLQLLASMPVVPSGGTSKLGSNSGEYREVMRYQFAPAGVTATASNIFYVYVSHYKSGTTSSDLTYRGEEAQIIRTNEAIDLPFNARVLYVGDYNVTGSSEAGYQTILAAAAPNGLAQGCGIDVMNTNDNQLINWGTSTTDTNILSMETEHSYNLEYRDDLQVMTTNVYYSAAGGLTYIPNTYHVFGNNGTTPYYGAVDTGGNTALAGRLVTNGPVFIPASQLFLDLTNASDHLPVVADYAVPMPAPVVSGITGMGSNLVMGFTNYITNGLLTILMTTNLTMPMNRWTTVTTNIAAGGNTTVTATNVLNIKNSSAYFILREN